jgi:hypothetical protein
LFLYDLLDLLFLFRSDKIESPFSDELNLS